MTSLLSLTARARPRCRKCVPVPGSIRSNSLILGPLISQPTSRTRGRNFSTGLTECFTWASDMTLSVTQAGVPWYITLPMIAVGVNFTVRLPFAYYSRRLQLRRQDLDPLMQAHIIHAKEVARAEGGLMLMPEIARQKARDARAQLYKAFGVQIWKSFAPLPLIMGPFLIMSGSIRQLCLVADRQSELSSTAHVDGGLAGTAADTAASIGHVAPLEVGLHDGGCLWFLDLTAKDPYYVLPAACAVLLVAQALKGRSLIEAWSLLKPPRKDQAQELSTSDRMTQLALRINVLFPMVPLILAELPSGIFLYWATTFAMNPLNEWILNRMVPLKTNVGMRPVKRAGLPFLYKSAANQVQRK